MASNDAKNKAPAAPAGNTEQTVTTYTEAAKSRILTAGVMQVHAFDEQVQAAMNDGAAEDARTAARTLHALHARLRVWRDAGFDAEMVLRHDGRLVYDDIGNRVLTVEEYEAETVRDGAFEDPADPDPSRNEA